VKQELNMSRECYFLGKGTRAGNSYAIRGKAKYLGGNGTKVTGITKRKFKANIQKVRALVDGKIVNLRVSAKAIKMGLVTKPLKRNYTPEAKAAN
jgi:large subunit ribosomal protein L28